MYIDGDVPLHQLMKFVQKDQELFIHGEERHSNYYAPIIYEVSRGCDFYMLELVNDRGDDLAPQPLMPFVYRIISTGML